MSELKLKYDEARKSDTSKQDQEKAPEQPKDIELYDTPGIARNICFGQADGKKTFLNYAYLISGEFIPGDNEIVLIFTSMRISLKGYFLELLYNDLAEHITKRITCTNKRYVETKNDNEPIVIEIVIQKSNSGSF